jgi:ferredoxin/flavodoxin
METEIYYFSGTGNSLHVAKEIQLRLSGSELIPMIPLIGQDSIKTSAKTIGIVFPLQGPTVPVAVRRFLERIDLKNTEYIFAVATRGGTTCSIRREIDKIIRRRGKSLSAHFIITVFNNDPKFKSGQKSYYCHPLSPAELSGKALEIEAKCDEICGIVKGRRISHKKDREYSFRYGFLLERIIIWLIKKQETKSISNYFYADSKCVGCGLCEKICLSGRISLKQGKPRWDDNVICYMCYACLNFCPAGSIQIRSSRFMKSYTTTEKRYEHPYATALDIQEQKKGAE